MTVHGEVAAGFEQVREAFATVVSGQAGTGAAVAIWHDGRWVVDLWGGAADAAGTRAWRRDSIVMPYSVTKAFTAMAALTLVDRGRLDLDAPVQRYWPELQAAATVRQLLSHQVGLVALADPAPGALLLDWDAMCRRLEVEEPLWASGTDIGESALFYGHLVGEIVRRADGRSLGTFLREEVCGPAGLDFAVGLRDDEVRRAVDLTGLSTVCDQVLSAERPELLRRALLNPPGALEPAVVNSDPFRRAEVPAINGHGTARAVAGLYAALLEGRLVSTALRDEAVRAQASGVDRVMGGALRSWGLGFAVDEEGYGMGGTGGSVGWACPPGRYAYGFRHRQPGHPRPVRPRRERLPTGHRPPVPLNPRRGIHRTVLLGEYLDRGGAQPGWEGRGARTGLSGIRHDEGPAPPKRDGPSSPARQRQIT